jgi:hypothetical protein
MKRTIKVFGYIAILICLFLLYTTKDYDFLNMLAAMLLTVVVAIVMYSLETFDE